MESNSSDALDIYAKVEELLGVNEVAPKLYSYYFDILKDIEFNSLLDIGCGKGEFLDVISKIGVANKLFGIDRSPLMVKEAKKRGVRAENIELKDIKERFDVAVATFDVVNYLTPDEFKIFFKDLKNIIKEGGYFIFDINSLYGLSELAVGNFIEDRKDKFIAIESFYENRVYESFFTLFEKDEERFKKSKGAIRQHYYSRRDFDNLKGWKIVESTPIDLYETESIDKVIYLLKRV